MILRKQKHPAVQRNPIAHLGNFSPDEGTVSFVQRQKFPEKERFLMFVRTINKKRGPGF